MPAPVGSERAPMPSHGGGGRHNLHGLPPVWPDVREQYPEQPIDRTEARSFRAGPLQHRELMPERENVRREIEPRADRGSKQGQQGDEQRSHLARERISLGPATATTATRTEYSVGTAGRSSKARDVFVTEPPAGRAYGAPIDDR